MITERKHCDLDDPFGIDSLKQKAIELGIDPDLARKMGEMGVLTIGGDSIFCLQVPNSVLNGISEFKYDGNHVEISFIKNGQKKSHAWVKNITLKDISFKYNGDLVVQPPEWHSFECFGITKSGQVLAGIRE